jgi:hypothetical protein
MALATETAFLVDGWPSLVYAFMDCRSHGSECRSREGQRRSVVRAIAKGVDV